MHSLRHTPNAAPISVLTSTSVSVSGISSTWPTVCSYPSATCGASCWSGTWQLRLPRSQTNLCTLIMEAVADRIPVSQVAADEAQFVAARNAVRIDGRLGTEDISPPPTKMQGCDARRSETRPMIGRCVADRSRATGRSQIEGTDALSTSVAKTGLTSVGLVSPIACPERWNRHTPGEAAQADKPVSVVKLESDRPCPERQGS